MNILIVTLVAMCALTCNAYTLKRDSGEVDPLQQIDDFINKFISKRQLSGNGSAPAYPEGVNKFLLYQFFAKRDENSTVSPLQQLDDFINKIISKRQDVPNVDPAEDINKFLIYQFYAKKDASNNGEVDPLQQIDDFINKFISKRQDAIDAPNVDPAEDINKFLLYQFYAKKDASNNGEIDPLQQIDDFINKFISKRDEDNKGLAGAIIQSISGHND
jgi:hypothetical protein